MQNRLITFWENHKKILIGIPAGILTFLILAAVALGYIAMCNDTWIEIEMSGSEEIMIDYDQTFKDGGARAWLRLSTFKFLERELPVETTGVVTDGKVGEYTLTYRCTSGDLSAEKKRIVKIVDTKLPSITLVEDPEAYTLPGHLYEEIGFSAWDDYDGDITGKVKCVEEDGVVTYTVSDSSGNTAMESRIIVYDDRTAPELDIGAANMTLLQGDKWDEPAVTAIDDLDGDISANVVKTGSVDTTKPGKYEITYNIEDSYGNAAVAVRTVTVLTNTDDVYEMAAAGEKVVFLTFDDGPGPYTEELLETLEEYGVKATFFVTDQRPEYEDLIGRAYEEGHAIGVHTLTHNFDEIYVSGTTFWNDIEAMNDIVEEQTGSRTDFFRFAGGSSNTVSMNYNNKDGIMGRLIAQAEKKGYDFFDWNVDSNDAGGATTSQEVYDNVISGVEELDISVVLMHDIHDFTVEAIPEILKYGQEHGWRFMTLKKGIYECRHDVNN